VATDPLIRENDTVAGKYLIGRTLGEGGMGVVVAARHLELDQMVAIKFLRAEIAQQGSSAERFRREARAAVKIRSEHVCRMLDVGTLENGVPYLVMEYLEGCDLSDEVARRGQLPIEEAIDYVLQACEALAEAHAAGIVHRDLKPGNLFLEVRRDGTRSIKVLDFGVSKSLMEAAGQLRLTQTASLIGSPLYMSPEQLDAAKDVDPRADIWALATILFELIAGRTPFYAETIPQLVHAVMTSSPPSFATLGVSVPPELENVILQSLSKERTLRHQNVADLARALAPFGPPHSIVSVLRAERVLKSTGSTSNQVPLASAASGASRTPEPTLGSDETGTSKTLDVSTLPTPATGETPAPRDRSDEKQWKRRPALIALLAVASVGGLAVLVPLLRRSSAAPTEPARSPTGVSAANATPSPAVPVVLPPAQAAEPPTEPSSVAAEPGHPAEVSAVPGAPSVAPAAAHPAVRRTVRVRPADSASAEPLTPKAGATREGITNFGGRR
jgi:serine/threonine protein kinase